MSVNCVECIKNKRTGTDLRCDECRRYGQLRLRFWKLEQQTRSYIIECIFGLSSRVSPTPQTIERIILDRVRDTKNLDELERLIKLHESTGS
jgi:hypothetical protein